MHKLLGAGIVCTVVALSDCVALAAGVIAAGAAYGVIKYENNEAVRDYRAGVAETFAAVRDQLVEMGYAVTSGIEVGPDDATIESREAELDVERFDDEFTRVRARFGTFETDESQAKAERLLSRWRAYRARHKPLVLQ